MLKVTCYFLNMLKTVSEAGILPLPSVPCDMVEALYSCLAHSCFHFGGEKIGTVYGNL